MICEICKKEVDHRFKYESHDTWIMLCQACLDNAEFINFKTPVIDDWQRDYAKAVDKEFNDYEHRRYR